MDEKSQVDPSEELLSHFKSTARHSKATGIDTTVFLVPCDREHFVSGQLKELRENGHGIFSRLKHKKVDYLEYQCERHNKPRGRSSGLSTQTRANCCKAFVSFKFVHQGHVTGCIRRLRSKHNGHDPSSQSEKCVGVIDKTVTSIVETLAFNGKNPSDIMKALRLWAKEQGHKDINDRRFHPSMQDVSNILKSYRKHLRFHCDDLLCMEKLLQGDLRLSCLSYHPLDLDLYCETVQSDLPNVLPESRKQSKFHVVLQSPEQAEWLEKEARGCVIAFVTLCGQEEKHHRKNLEQQQRNFSAYIVSIMGQDAAYSIPVASVIIEQGREEALVSGLLSLQENCPHFYPSAFMTDGDTFLTKCINQVWPDSLVLWAWSSVMQTASEWITFSGKSGQSADFTHYRHLVLRSLWRLKLCTTKKQFSLKAKLLLEKIDKMTSLSSQTRKKCQTYLETDWILNADRWSDCGREFLMAQWLKLNVQFDTLDRIFLKQQLQFGTCGFCQKLDFLILMLHHSVNLFFTTFHTHSPQFCYSQTETSGGARQSSECFSQPDQLLQESCRLEGTDRHAKTVKEECFVSHTDDTKQQHFVSSNAEPVTARSSRYATENTHMREELCTGIPCQCKKIHVNHKDSDKCTQHVSSNKEVETRTGDLHRAVWMTEGTCLLPSDKSLFVSWRVDYVAMVCSCPEALLFDTCRHLKAVPEARQARVAKLRQSLASDVVAKGLFHHQAKRLYILRAEHYLYMVNTLSQSESGGDNDTPPGSGSHLPASETSLWECVKQALLEAGFTKYIVGSAVEKEARKHHNSLHSKKVESKKENVPVLVTDTGEGAQETVEEKVVEMIHADDHDNKCVTGRNHSCGVTYEVSDDATKSACSVSVRTVTAYKTTEETISFTNGDADLMNCACVGTAGHAAATAHAQSEASTFANKAAGMVNDVNSGFTSDVEVGVVNDEFTADTTNEGASCFSKRTTGMTDCPGGGTDVASNIAEDVCKVTNSKKIYTATNEMGTITTNAVEKIMMDGKSHVTPSQLLLSMSVPLADLSSAASTSIHLTPKVSKHQSTSSIHLPVKHQDPGSSGLPLLRLEPHSLPKHVNKEHRDCAKVLVTLPSAATDAPCSNIPTKKTYSRENCSDMPSENYTVSGKTLALGTAHVKLPCSKKEFIARNNEDALTRLHNTSTTDSLCLSVSHRKTHLRPSQKLSQYTVEATNLETTAQLISSTLPPPGNTLNDIGEEKLSKLSTRTMIEELAAWTQSKHFIDSPEIRAAVTSVYRAALSSNAGGHGSRLMEVSSLTSEGSCSELDDALHGMYQTSSVGCKMVEQENENLVVMATAAARGDTSLHETLAFPSVDSKSIAPSSPSQSVAPPYSHLQTLRLKENTSTHATEHQALSNQQQRSLLHSAPQAKGDSPSSSTVDTVQVTTTTNSCLDDLVRRLEARQQLAAEDISCLAPSPSKKPRMQLKGEGAAFHTTVSPPTKKTPQSREENGVLVPPSTNSRPDSSQGDNRIGGACLPVTDREPRKLQPGAVSNASRVVETERGQKALEAIWRDASVSTLVRHRPPEDDWGTVQETEEVCLPVAGLTSALPETGDSNESNSITYIVQSDPEEGNGNVIYIVTV